jgi:hypothetical protein
LLIVHVRAPEHSRHGAILQSASAHAPIEPTRAAQVLSLLQKLDASQSLSFAQGAVLHAVPPALHA